MPKPIQRVLIYRLGSLGDTVIALPSLHRIARAYPDAERRMLTNFPVTAKAPAAVSILGETGLAHGYIRYATQTRSLKAIFKLWLEIVRFRPQVLVYLAAARGIQTAKRDAKFFRICGIPAQIGVPLTEDMQVNRATSRTLATPSIMAPALRLLNDVTILESEAERLFRNLDELQGSEMNFDLQLTDDERATAEAALEPAAGRPILCAAVGTKVQSKDWGTANWQALLTQLGRLYPGHVLALFGAGSERELSDEAGAGWPTPPLNLCGLSPRESAAAFARAVLYLGLDSGNMHLAAAVGTPCVGIFAAHMPPGTWFPHGSNHRVIYHPVNCMACSLDVCIDEGRKCLLSITVDEVVRTVQDLLPV